MVKTKLNTLALGALLALVTVAAPAQIPYATMQVISNGDSDAVIAEKAAKVLPRANQTDWMRLGSGRFFSITDRMRFTKLSGAADARTHRFLIRPRLMLTNGSTRWRKPAVK